MLDFVGFFMFACLSQVTSELLEKRLSVTTAPSLSSLTRRWIQRWP